MILKPAFALLVAAWGTHAFPTQEKDTWNTTTCSKARCRIPPPPPPCPSPEEEQNRFGFTGEQTATFAQNGPIATLSPNIHWTYDTQPAANVIPVPPSKGSQMYYGVGDPDKAGAFAFLTYYFTTPSVNLDHCDQVSGVGYATEVLTVTFTSEEAYQHAIDTWNSNDGLILIAYTKGCGDFAKGERCYFKVSDLDFSAPGFVITATGRPNHPDEVITSGDTEWGWWAPKDSPNRGPSGPENPPGPSFVWPPGPSPQHGSGPSGPGDVPPGSGSFSVSFGPDGQLAPSGLGVPGSDPGSGPLPTPARSTPVSGPSDPGQTGVSGPPASTLPGQASGSGQPANPTAPPVSVSVIPLPGGSTVISRSALTPSTRGPSINQSPLAPCGPPVDTFGLPTACLGEAFDSDLDTALTFTTLSPEGVQFVLSLVPDFLDVAVPTDADLADLDGLDLGLEPVPEQRRHRKRWDVLSRVLGKNNVQAFKKVWNIATGGTPPGSSLNREFGWLLPDRRSATVSARRLIDQRARPARSPWGDSILLKSFTSRTGSVGQGQVKQSLDVHCVGCGVQGKARLAGRAKWTPLTGFTEGVVDISTDMMFVLQLGIDAQITYRRTFKSELFNVALPGLSYGIVAIGPRITVGYKAQFAAAAKGRLLAGAEMGFKDARVTIDFVDTSKTKPGGWKPEFNPIFDAQGELAISASLGLPIGIKCGVKISFFDKSVGVIDEPSIKAVAQVAAQIGNTGGSFGAGFTSADGCAGISTQLSWRNKLYVDIFGRRKIPLLDTKDQALARKCFPLVAPSASLAPPVVRGLPGRAAPAPIAIRQTEEDEDIVEDTTPSNSSEVSYDLPSVPVTPYADAAGREYARLVDPDGVTMVISCSNGNIYPVLAGSPESLECTELWASAEDILIYDGAQRLMHYYNNTMSQVGVSRLRVEDEIDVPVGGVVVFLGPYADPQNPAEYQYVAIDPYDQVFYPIVCQYADGSPAKVFLAKDPVAGIQTLQSEDVIYSITGGRVSACYVFVLNQGTRQT